MNWKNATVEQALMLCDVKINAGEGMTVSPKWLRETLLKLRQPQDGLLRMFVNGSQHDSPDTHEEILKIWPGAIWFPDCPPPIGTWVVDIQYPNVRQKVVGIDENRIRHLCHCETCCCSKPNVNFGWAHCQTKERIAANDQMAELKYPPCLRPAE